MRAFKPLLLTITLSSLFAPWVHADDKTTTEMPEQAEQPTGKAGLDYVSIMYASQNNRNIGNDSEQATTTAVAVALGTYLTDMFKIEMRYGRGIKDGTASSNLKLGLDWYVNWYIGLQYPWTDFSNIYAQYGFSTVMGHADLGSNTANYPKLHSDLFGASFSPSWLVGTDVSLTHNTYLFIEGGKLHQDTRTNIDTYQYNLGLRYEF
ncbi:outer membrane beta-barrel protein [Mangrovitalea sediminis]|uniref:outer membrane beta-barrel protein n=1 Tax=Mangrovitalea sediminis TaxID=1982043 RepID=UPI000BE4FE55|nr:outer membrane beta-barrel protein [Mangrovitalea sediminis]